MKAKFAVRYRWDPAMKASFEPRIRLRRHWDLVRLAAKPDAELAPAMSGAAAAREEDAKGRRKGLVADQGFEPRTQGL